MKRRTAGIGLIFTAAMLYASRFITAALFGSGAMSWNKDFFRSLLQYTDQGLTTVSIIALVAGLIYLVWAEIETAKKS